MGLNPSPVGSELTPGVSLSIELNSQIPFGARKSENCWCWKRYHVFGDGVGERPSVTYTLLFDVQ